MATTINSSNAATKEALLQVIHPTNCFILASAQMSVGMDYEKSFWVRYMKIT